MSINFRVLSIGDESVQLMSRIRPICRHVLCFKFVCLHVRMFFLRLTAVLRGFVYYEYSRIVCDRIRNMLKVDRVINLFVTFFYMKFKSNFFCV